MRNLRIGLLVAIALGIFMLTILSLGQEQRFWQRKAQYEIHFARTNGLQKGALVSLNGVTIGSVEELRFPPDPTDTHIQVLINIASNVAERIREDTTAAIRTYGLLGDRYIELSAGSTTAGPLPPGALIRAVDPIDYEQVLGQSGGDIVSNVVEVTASLRDVLQSIQRGEGLLGAMLRNRELGEATITDLRQTMANLQETTHSLDRILVRVERGEGLLGQMTMRTKENAKLLTRIDRSVANVEDVTRRLSEGKGALPRLFEDKAYADRVLANLDRAVADLAEITAKMKSNQGTLGKLINDPGLYHEAEALVGRARRSWAVRALRLLGGNESSEAPPADAPPAAPTSPASPDVKAPPR
jgi:phospholipid/cholesterol/gamma-HCH transport system substrate-binding protein